MADEDDGLDDDEQEGGVFRWMSTLVVLLAIAGFFGLAWYAYKNGGDAVDEKDVELVKADTAPVKEAPVNPGGMQIPNQDKTVYGLISGKPEKQPVVERILPAPEEPMKRGGDTETWMSDSVKDKTGGQEVAQAAPPATAPAAAPAPKEQFNPAKIRAAQQAASPKEAGPKETQISQHVSIAEATPTPPTPTLPIAAPPAPAPAPVAAAAPPKPVAPAAVEKKVATAEADDDDEKPQAKPETKSEAKPEAKPEAKAEAKPAAAAPPAGARAQLGSFRSQAEAESNWAKISHDFADELKSRQHYVVRADLGAKGIYYRLQVAPFASSKDAEEFCIDFVSSGAGCIVAKGK